MDYIYIILTASNTNDIHTSPLLPQLVFSLLPQLVRPEEEVSNPNPSLCKLLAELKVNDEQRNSNYIRQIHIHN